MRIYDNINTKKHDTRGHGSMSIMIVYAIKLYKGCFSDIRWWNSLLWFTVYNKPSTGIEPVTSPLPWVRSTC